MSQSLFFTADQVFTGRRFVRDCSVLARDGRIADVGQNLTRPSDAEHVNLSGHALVPGCVNSHTHTFQVLLRGNGDNATNFRDWVDGHLYPLVSRLDERMLAAAATLAYAEMALSGTTSVGEFFYVHNDATSKGGNRNAEATVGAARSLGMRIALLRTMYDQGSKPGQTRFHETVAEASDNVRALAARFAEDTAVTVLPAPHSLHGASEPMIRAAVEIADELDRPFHIHLAEQSGDVAYALERYGATPLRALDSLGALSRRTVIVHGIWLDEGERMLLAERGGGLAYNPLTNMALGDGIAQIPDLIRRGVSISLGTDANNRLNLYDEMRAVEYLQRVSHLEMGIVPGSSASSRGSALPLFEMGTVGGARNLGLDTGRIESGAWADLVAIDLADPSLLPASLVGGDDLLNAMVYSMVAQTAVRHSWVAGEPLVVNRTLARMSLGEIRGRVREALGA